MNPAANEAKAAGGKGRLKEILSVLSRHNAMAGMTPVKLCGILEDLGPTFVKLGQIMSMRPELLPAAYCEALQKLRTHAAPMPMEEVRRVVERSLGMPLHKAFPYFDPTPLGSASIAQVHRARLRDGGEAAVKVQREGIHDVMRSDIALLRKAAGLMRLTPTGEAVDLNMVLDEMWVVSQEEMNFSAEAKNAEEFARYNQNVAYVACPKVYRKYSTPQVLAMEYVDGFSLLDRDALEKAGYDPAEIARKLCASYMKQVLDDGFFHADPHPGNLRVREGRIVWLDMGMMGRLSARDQGCFDRALRAFVRGDAGELTDVVLALGVHREPVNREALYADVDDLMSEYGKVEIGEIDLGRLLQQALDLAGKHRISMPSGVAMLGRGLCTLQGTVAAVSPGTSLVEVLSQRLAHSAFRGTDVKGALRRDGAALYESAQKSLNIPALLSDTLRLAQKGELKLVTEACASRGEERRQDLRETRRRLCLLCGAFFLGASLMTLAPDAPRALGLPVPALIGFALAAAAGLSLWLKRPK